MANPHVQSPMIPLPKRTRVLIERHLPGANPGLLLDKYVASWIPGQNEKGDLAQLVQRPALGRLIGATEPGGIFFGNLWNSWSAMIDALKVRHGGTRFEMTTTSPLAIHLSRASALENAGICLHPIYGFVYLPGTGLKGLAHAYACEVWLRSQSPERKQAAFGLICSVFGYAPSPWLRDLAAQHEVAPPPFTPRSAEDGPSPRQSCGTIVFHDAWPKSVPKLALDIVNCHHPEYYSKGEPPGDWENPIPVNFPVVTPGQTFEFALTRRRDDTGVPHEPGATEDHLALAEQWLIGGLVELGCGAKTAAGYGMFRTACSKHKSISRPRGLAHQFELGLVLSTPAFLAGAYQGRGSATRDSASQCRESCDLRVPTLRGQLRWWWRTMHAGYMNERCLARLEAALWGSSMRGSPIRVVLEPGSERRVTEANLKEPYVNPSGKTSLRPLLAFARKFNLSLPRQATPGYLFLAYGMDELDGDMNRNQRFYVEPGATWTLRITIGHRDSPLRARRGAAGAGPELNLTSEQMLRQVQAAMWLLFNHGGVGSKSRNGFGCFRGSNVGPIVSIKDCSATAAELRAAIKQDLAISDKFDWELATSASLQAAELLDAEFAAENPWQAIDRIGSIYRDFTQAPFDSGHGKHCPAKASLGLPRLIHRRPRQEPLISPMGDRYAKPFHIHLSSQAPSHWRVKIMALSVPWHYPIQAGSRESHSFALDHEQNRAMMRSLLDHFDASLYNE